MVMDQILSLTIFIQRLYFDQVHQTKEEKMRILLQPSLAHNPHNSSIRAQINKHLNYARTTLLFVFSLHPLDTIPSWLKIETPLSKREVICGL